MPFPVFPTLPFPLPEMSFPFHPLKIKSLPIALNHEYYSDRFLNDLLAILPECFLLFAVFVVLLFGVISSSSKREESNDEKNLSSIFGILVGVNTSLMAILSLVFTILLLSNLPFSNLSFFDSYFRLDDAAVFFKMLVLVGTLFSIVISLQYIQLESLNPFELQVLILISAISMLFLICSADSISIYLAIECQSLCFYVMAGMKRENEFSTEAGLKYFLLGAFSSGILLFGLALQYGFTGTTHFSEISKIFTASWSFSQDAQQMMTNHLSSNATLSSSLSSGSSVLPGISSLRGCELGMIFILVGFLFKASAVPFHMWAPDVYEGAPTSVTAFFAIVPKVSILAILMRLCYKGCYDFMLSAQKILILSSILSMIVGSLAALSQNKIKRLLAWSSIGHVGYLLTAVSCGTIEGIEAVIFYLVIYIVMTISLFQLALVPMRREKINGEDRANYSRTAFQQSATGRNAESDNQHIKYTTDLAFAAKTNPIIAITISITMFSIAGIPPLAGFYSKAFLLFAAMSVKQYLLATIVIGTSVISCFYYIRIVKIMYFEAHLPAGKTSHSQNRMLSFMPISKEISLVFGLTLAVLAFFGFSATALFTETHNLALSFS